MRKLVLLAASVASLSGCVTENTYVGSDKPVVQKEINNNNAARTRISLALNYLSQGNSTQAKYNLERAAKFAPELPEVHYSMAYYYQQVGEDQRAVDAYERALKIDPNDPNTLNNYGVFLCDLGQYDEAVAQLMAAIEVPSYLRVAETYENLALCALKFDKFDAAEEFLETSLQHSSLRPSSLINLAAVKYAKSDFYQAQKTLERYGSTGRISSRSLLLSYLVEQRMGHLEEARKLAKTIETTYPSSLEARIVREQRYSASEFEQLREQYRLHQLEELSGAIADNTVVAEPKIKVVKKKSSKKPVALSAPDVQAAIKDKQINEQVTKDKATAAVEQAEQSDAVDAQVQVEQVEQTSPATEQAQSDEVAETGSAMEEAFIAATAIDLSSQESEPSRQEPEVSTPEAEAASQVQSNEPTVLNTSFNTELNQELEVPFHVVEKGENLFNISARYNIRLAKLQQWNGLENADRVYVGRKIYLNDPNIYHTVERGDTLSSISSEYNILMERLMQWNNLQQDAPLETGKKILLVNPDNYHL